MASERPYDPDLEWIDHIRPTGLVVAGSVLKDHQLVPVRQTEADTSAVSALIDPDPDEPALSDPWRFFSAILGWRASDVAGAPEGPALPSDLAVVLPEQATLLVPDWAMAAPKGTAGWQLLVKLEGKGIDPDQRGAVGGWEATPHQRFERLLRESGVSTGVLVWDRELRLIHAPRGETSGWLAFPLRALTGVAGRVMLGGLKLLLTNFRLHNDAEARRLPQILKASREAQAKVSTKLAEQVLGALHELLRGFDHAEPDLIRELARTRSHHLYEGLLTVLLRLVFLLYAEDRDLVPSRNDGPGRALYQANYSVRGLFAKLEEDTALNPDTMDERTGAWGRLLATFRLLHEGDHSGWIRARGGKLFDRTRFGFLEGRAAASDAAQVPKVTDGCVHRVLTSLMTLAGDQGVRERLSYRTLDVEQIGSVYETVMGFTVDVARGAVLAIKAGKNNKTPVFVDLDALAARKGVDRIKSLKESADRALTAKQDKAVKEAKSAADLAAALEGIADERGSPGRHPAPAGTPILQPTAERRRTGSHYTPRELTEPIVRHALEPIFERLGADATPERVLEIKVCDPAMGSGAFLVEACRTLAARLVKAWERHPGTRSALPPDEDDDLHARRLVAQRCLYGVDKNPMAVDLARLSLWLATLARDHEFTFLDHALKCGDSLVGLTVEQMSRLHWDETADGMPLYAGLIRERVTAALHGREEIRTAPDDVTAAIQEVRYRAIESRLDDARAIGDAVIAAFFASDKGKARERERAEVEQALNGNPPKWDEIKRRAAAPRQGEHPLSPFHWELEFPEVFRRDNPGFDAFVGNPPFAGKNTITDGSGAGYLLWLKQLHRGAHGNADLGAHFYRRCFGLLRAGGCFGLIATKTIRQGDTRDTGLKVILATGGTIYRAQRRVRWPGEAAVVIAVVHIQKGD